MFLLSKSSHMKPFPQQLQNIVQISQEFFTSGSAGTQWVPSSTEEIYWDLIYFFVFWAGEGGNFECVKWSLTVRTFTLSQNQSLRDRDTQSEIILWDWTYQGSTQHVSLKKTWPPRHEEGHSDLCQRQPSLANNPCCIVSVKISGETWNRDSDVVSSSYIGCIISSYTVIHI